MFNQPMWGNGWFPFYDHVNCVAHSLPNYDLGRHHLVDCPCRPVDCGDVIVHNSFDGRENFELGLRKLS